MKKILIGGLVGGILLFAWQTVSWTVANLHAKSQHYSPKQDSVLNFLANTGIEPGGYMFPMPTPEATWEESEKQMKPYEGKPWARLTYYKTMHFDMGMNMARGALANIIIACLLCWLFAKMGKQGFSTYFIASLAIGIICFTNGAYTGHIWYPIPDINAHFMDAIASWGLVGVWLGWWMNRK